MKLFNSAIKKVILFILISIIVFTGWEFSLETAYLRLLVNTTNVSVGVIKKDTFIEIESTNVSNEPYQLKVHTRIEGRRGTYPQEIGSLLQPFVIVISWQIFLLLILNVKSALRSLGMNFIIFFIVQVFFLILLTGYHSSDSQKFFFNVMMDSFYVVAIILIIKDNMLYPVFKR